MKLRNRQTGKVYTLSDDLYIEYTQGGKTELRAIIPGGNMSYYYDSLDELNKDWEDYEPVEPLIKDEKIRKAVRAWAEAIKINGARYDEFWRSFRFDNCTICFKGEYCFSELEDGKNYTIAELCGEEE